MHQGEARSRPLADRPENYNDLLKALSELSVEVQRLSKQQRDWRISLRNGILAGLGGVLGATVVVSVLGYVLQPFKKLEGIGPMIDRLDSTLRRTVKDMPI